MNRRLAVLGLAVAMCGTGSVVAGQARPDEPSNRERFPPNLERLVADLRLMPQQGPDGSRERLQRSLENLAADLRQMPQQGQTTFRVESVGSPTRIHLTTDGSELGTLEAVGFTITTQASGTTIAASGPVTMVTSDGKTISVEGFTLHLSAGGRFSASGSSLPIGKE